MCEVFVTRLIICFVEVVLDSRDRDILNNYIPLLAELVESRSRAYRFARDSVVATFLGGALVLEGQGAKFPIFESISNFLAT